MLFYLGTHVLKHAPHFERCCISVNRLWRYDRHGILHRRISDFAVNHWIMDSGAFSEISTYGKYRFPVEDYANQVNRWKTCGTLDLAVTQDFMCEPSILSKTGLTVEQHQHLTIDRYDTLISMTDVLIMPVLQGYKPSEYIHHIALYGDRLKPHMRVGVGSVCKRNGNPESVIAVLEAITNARPDLKLHGFGLKTKALANSFLLSLLYSADSMAWSMAARRNGGDRNGLQEATNFVIALSKIQGTKPHQFNMLKQGNISTGG